jgi:predicted DsbA family dithiol-disulfide isomerase
MSDRPPLRIDVLADVVCPWCFIGKRRLERAIAMKPDIPVDLHWRPYFLNDWIPRGGISREQYLTSRKAWRPPQHRKG